MLDPRHRIRRAVLEVQLEDARLAWQVQGRVSQWQTQSLEAVLDGVLSTFCPADRLYRIDRLELDLGPLSLERIEQELHSKLAPALLAALQTKREHDMREAALLGASAIPRAALELLAHFVETGTVPWWADARTPDVVATALRSLLPTITPAEVAAFHSLLRRREARLRLVLHCDDDALLLLIPHLVQRAGYAAVAPSVLHVIRALLKPAPTGTAATTAADATRLRAAVWLGFLHPLAGPAASLSSEEDLWNEALTWVAIEAGLRSSQLFAQLVWPALRQTGTPPPAALVRAAQRAGADGLSTPADARRTAIPPAARAAEPGSSLPADSFFPAIATGTPDPPSASDSHAPSLLHSHDFSLHDSHSSSLPESQRNSQPESQSIHRPRNPAAVAGSAGARPEALWAAARPKAAGPSVDSPQSSSEFPTWQAPQAEPDSWPADGAPTPDGAGERAVLSSHELAASGAQKTDLVQQSVALFPPLFHPPSDAQSASDSAKHFAIQSGRQSGRQSGHESGAPSRSQSDSASGHSTGRTQSGARDVRSEALPVPVSPSAVSAAADRVEPQPASGTPMDRESHAANPMLQAVRAALAALGSDLPQALRARAAECSALLNHWLDTPEALPPPTGLQRRLLQNLSALRAHQLLPVNVLQPALAALDLAQGNHPPGANAPPPGRPSLRPTRPGTPSDSPLSGEASQPAAHARRPDFAQEDALVHNAGLVLLWPFLPTLFENLGLLHEQRFADPAAAQRAAGLLQHVATGDSHPPEYQLALPKVLCGVDEGLAFDFGDRVTEAEAAECSDMLHAAMQHAGVLVDGSLADFRERFLLRGGVLVLRDDSWLLRIERSPYNVLVQKFPWQNLWIRLPWLDRPLYAEW